MNIKHLPFCLSSGLVLGSCLLVIAIAPKAQAQAAIQSDITGNIITNLSDITGPIVTTSDIAGGAFAPGAGRRTYLAFRNSSVEVAVNQAALSLNSQLGQPLASLLTATGNVDVSASQLETGLINATGGPSATTARSLSSSLRGLTAGGRVNPAKLAAAVAAYNALIDSSDGLFLRNPPEELLSIQSLLGALVNAGLGAGGGQ